MYKYVCGVLEAFLEQHPSSKFNSYISRWVARIEKKEKPVKDKGYLKRNKIQKKNIMTSFKKQKVFYFNTALWNILVNPILEMFMPGMKQLDQLTKLSDFRSHQGFSLKLEDRLGESNHLKCLEEPVPLNFKKVFEIENCVLIDPGEIVNNTKTKKYFNNIGKCTNKKNNNNVKNLRTIDKSKNRKKSFLYNFLIRNFVEHKVERLMPNIFQHHISHLCDFRNQHHILGKHSSFDLKTEDNFMDYRSNKLHTQNEVPDFSLCKTDVLNIEKVERIPETITDPINDQNVVNINNAYENITSLEKVYKKTPNKLNVCSKNTNMQPTKILNKIKPPSKVHLSSPIISTKKINPIEGRIKQLNRIETVKKGSEVKGKKDNTINKSTKGKANGNKVSLATECNILSTQQKNKSYNESNKSSQNSENHKSVLIDDLVKNENNLKENIPVYKCEEKYTNTIIKCCSMTENEPDKVIENEIRNSIKSNKHALLNTQTSKNNNLHGKSSKLEITQKEHFQKSLNIGDDLKQDLSKEAKEKDVRNNVPFTEKRVEIINENVTIQSVNTSNIRRDPSSVAQNKSKFELDNELNLKSVLLEDKQQSEQTPKNPSKENLAPIKSEANQIMYQVSLKTTDDDEGQIIVQEQNIVQGKKVDLVNLNTVIDQESSSFTSRNKKALPQTNSKSGTKKESPEVSFHKPWRKSREELNKKENILELKGTKNIVENCAPSSQISKDNLKQKITTYIEHGLTTDANMTNSTRSLSYTNINEKQNLAVKNNSLEKRKEESKVDNASKICGLKPFSSKLPTIDKKPSTKDNMKTLEIGINIHKDNLKSKPNEVKSSASADIHTSSLDSNVNISHPIKKEIIKRTNRKNKHTWWDSEKNKKHSSIENKVKSISTEKLAPIEKILNEKSNIRMNSIDNKIKQINEEQSKHTKHSNETSVTQNVHKKEIDVKRAPKEITETLLNNNKNPIGHSTGKEKIRSKIKPQQNENIGNESSKQNVVSVKKSNEKLGNIIKHSDVSNKNINLKKSTKLNLEQKQENKTISNEMSNINKAKKPNETRSTFRDGNISTQNPDSKSTINVLQRSNIINTNQQKSSFPDKGTHLKQTHLQTEVNNENKCNTTVEVVDSDTILEKEQFNSEINQLLNNFDIRGKKLNSEKQPNSLKSKEKLIKQDKLFKNNTNIQQKLDKRMSSENIRKCNSMKINEINYIHPTLSQTQDDKKQNSSANNIENQTTDRLRKIAKIQHVPNKPIKKQSTGNVTSEVTIAKTNISDQLKTKQNNHNIQEHLKYFNGNGNTRHNLKGKN